MGTSKLPAIQFYPGDWRKDVGVQSLSFHDRGVWFEMLMLMHESEQRGLLILNSQPMNDDAVARLLGLNKQTLVKTLDRLLSSGVASRDEQTGALMCRRMVRDEHVRCVRTEAGKQGGNPNLVKQKTPDAPILVNHTANQIPTPSSSSSLSTTTPKQKLRTLPQNALERVYAAYPRKVGKGAAIKAIKKTLLRIAPDRDVGWLEARVLRFAAQCEFSDAQYVPHPATWFNQERYDDPEDANGIDRPGQDQTSNPSDGDDEGGEDRSGLFEALYGTAH